MKIIMRTAAAAAAICTLAAPAYAQSVNANANGAFGRVSLTSGFTPDPREIAVTAGGPVDAATVGAHCSGRIAQRPSVTLRYNAGDFPLIISADSESDTTLVVRAPDGAYYCNDDTVGLDPALRFDTPASGRYQIWVGMFSSDGVSPPATLYISEIAAGKFDAESMPNPLLDPAYGAIDLTSGFTPDPHTQQISAGGGFEATLLAVPGCVGWIATAPDYRVNWTAGSGALPLVFSVESDADTTLVVNLPNGDWICDDDGGNGALNPAITLANPASGQYDIWVGTFAQGELQPSTLHVSELYAQ